MRIGDQTIDEGSSAFVIAELGHNHQGDLATCLEMIRAAASAGASAVKLQTRTNSKVYTPAAFNSPYTSENAYGKTYGLHREFLEFDKFQYSACINEANENGIIFFSTAFDIESADFLNELDVPAFKIASGDLKSLPLIEHVASFKKPVIISTGGATIEDIDRAVEVLEGKQVPFAILQCTAAYPPSFEELNLKVIETYAARYTNAIVGYSGHDSGIAMSIVAYVLGARIIEKHFTLNRAMKGTDHAFSLEPQGMRKLVRDLERTKISLGDGIKKIYTSEIEPIRKMGKSLYSSRVIEQGQLITLEDIEMRSPAVGLQPFQLNNLIGVKAKRKFEAFDSFSQDDIA